MINTPCHAAVQSRHITDYVISIRGTCTLYNFILIMYLYPDLFKLHVMSLIISRDKLRSANSLQLRGQHLLWWPSAQEWIFYLKTTVPCNLEGNYLLCRASSKRKLVINARDVFHKEGSCFLHTLWFTFSHCCVVFWWRTLCSSIRPSLNLCNEAQLLKYSPHTNHQRLYTTILPTATEIKQPLAARPAFKKASLFLLIATNTTKRRHQNSSCEATIIV